jgi:hypothetical protein
MRRYLFAALASIALIAAVPASSMARTHHHKSHKSHKSSRRHHVRAHTRRFGDVNAPAAAPSSMDAGTVASFTPNSTNTGGTLVIKLNDTAGTTISGQVTPDTEIECEAMDSSFSRDDGGPGPSGGGDQGNGRGDQGDNHDANDNANDNDNDNRDNDDNDEANNQDCTSALVAGTAVREAELRISSGGAVWHKIELAS